MLECLVGVQPGDDVTVQGSGHAAQKRVELVPTTLGEWHEQTLAVSGTHVSGLLDGKVHLEAPVSGQVGLSSKTDTIVLFDRFSAPIGYP